MNALPRGAGNTSYGEGDSEFGGDGAEGYEEDTGARVRRARRTGAPDGRRHTVATSVPQQVWGGPHCFA